MASLVTSSPLQEPNAFGFAGWRRSLRARRGPPPPKSPGKVSDSSSAPVDNVRHLLGQKPVSVGTDEQEQTQQSNQDEPTSPTLSAVVAHQRSNSIGRTSSFRNAMRSPMVSPAST
eukprot:scpid17515/ scgid3497/ 